MAATCNLARPLAGPLTWKSDSRPAWQGGKPAGMSFYSFDFSDASLPTGAVLERETSGTRFNSSGVLVVETTDVARFDYDPVSLGLLGLLVEPQRTNSVRSSEDCTVSGSLYQIQNGSIVSNAGTAPDGAITADKYISSVTDTPHHLAQVWWLGASGFPPVAGHKYCSSFFVKAAGYDYLYIAVNNTFSGGTYYCYFDIVSGAFGSFGAGLTSSDLTVFDAGGGWQRPQIRWPAKASPVAGDSCWGLDPTTVMNSRPSYAGDGTSGVLVWGWQLEDGDFPTSYIPNSSTTNAATRSADLLTLDVPDGVWDVEITTANGTFSAAGLSISGNAGYAFDWSDFSGASTERHLLSVIFNPTA